MIITSSSPWLSFASHEGGGGGGIVDCRRFGEIDETKVVLMNATSTLRTPPSAFTTTRIARQQNKYHNKHLGNTGHYEPILFGVIF